MACAWADSLLALCEHERIRVAKRYDFARARVPWLRLVSLFDLSDSLIRYVSVGILVLLVVTGMLFLR